MDKTGEELVAEINQAHEDVVNGRGTLVFAVKAGELLTNAHEAVRRRKGDWEVWLKHYCPKIAVSTARLYEKFYKEQDKLIEKGGANALAVLGVRQAREMLESDATKKARADAKEKAKRQAAEKAAQAAAKQKGAPVAQTIQAESAPDIIVKAIKDADLEPADLREIVRGLDDGPPGDLVEEAKALINRLDLAQLTAVVEY